MLIIIAEQCSIFESNCVQLVMRLLKLLLFQSTHRDGYLIFQLNKNIDFSYLHSEMSSVKFEFFIQFTCSLKYVYRTCT